MPERVRRRYLLIALVYGAALGLVVFWPFDADRLWNFSDRWLRLPYTPGREILFDVVVNVAVFVPAGFLLHGWWRGAAAPSRWTAAGALLVVAALALTIEVLQGTLGWRQGSVRDALADLTGAAIGIGLEALLRRR